ncbi:hypothetical protein EV178_000775 [Coemansia sp. RSA 1646]|nr:hypothetical protein EV178_000775 [Coemansia sp. RSA 1646]
MDVRVDKHPFLVNGVHWSVANRWIIGTSAQAFIVTPECTMRGEFKSTSYVSATIEASQDIEAVCLLDSLPGKFAYEHAIVLLASDSSIRIHAPKGLPSAVDWDEVGRGAFGTGASHVCAIASTQILDSNGDTLPVVSCATVGGEVTVLGLESAHGDHIEAKLALMFHSGNELISHVAWTANEATDTAVCRPLLAVCAVDGTVNLWDVARDLTSANMVCTLGSKDWRPITASASCASLFVLAKLGTVIVVDTSTSGSREPALASSGFEVECIDLGITQSITSCVIDKQRERIYISAMDFVILVLKRAHGGRWTRAEREEETALREGMRKTVIRSFTTKFNMSQLLLRSMCMSPNKRYLMFVADDQVNWGLVKDGVGVTRIHFYQFEDWTVETAKSALDNVVRYDHQGDLQYKVWDLFHNTTASEATELVEYLNQMQLQRGSDAYQQRLFVLNLLDDVIGKARNTASDHHVKNLFKRIKELISNKDVVLSDKDQEYLAQASWAVRQESYADIVDELPCIMDNDNEAEPRCCPVCQKADTGMKLRMELAEARSLAWPSGSMAEISPGMTWKAE